MDSIRIPPTDLASLLAERAERIERTRNDRDRKPPFDRPRRRRKPPPAPDEPAEDSSGERGNIIEVDA